MDIRIILILTSVILTVTSCIDNCENADYEFQLKIRYSPIKDTFNIGDTLHVSSLFTDELYDPNLEVTRDLRDFSFYTSIVLTIVRDEDKIPVELKGSQLLNSDINFNLIDYSFGGSGILIEKHNYVDNEYSFSFDLILQKAGIYYINTYSRLGQSINTSQQRFEGQCAHDEITARYKVNDGDAYENNFDLIEGIPAFGTTQDFNFNDTGGFAFIVKE